MFHVPTAGISDCFAQLLKSTQLWRHKLLRIGGVPTSLTFIVQVVADVLSLRSLWVGAQRRAIHILYLYLISAPPPRPLVPNTVISSMSFLWMGEPVWPGGKTLG